MCTQIYLFKRKVLGPLALALAVWMEILPAPVSAQLSHEHAAELALDAYVKGRPFASDQGWKTYTLNDEHAVYGFVGIRANTTHIEHAVVLRGSVNADDWVTNLSMEFSPLRTVGSIERFSRIADVKVHKGMYARARLIVPLVKQLIEEHSPKVGRRLVRNYYFGHSLGGGLASLLSFEAHEPVSQLVTFGSASPGNDAFVMAIDKKIREQTQYVLLSDLIPSLSKLGPAYVEMFKSHQQKKKRGQLTQGNEGSYLSKNTKYLFSLPTAEDDDEDESVNGLGLLLKTVVKVVKGGHSMEVYLKAIRQGNVPPMEDVRDFIRAIFDEDNEQRPEF